MATIANDAMSFLSYLNPIGTAEAATPQTSPAQQQAFTAAATIWTNAGVPYVYGGTTTAGADCSGSIDGIYALAGIDIGHMLSGDFRTSPNFVQVTGPLEVGDVGWTVGHVVMYGGNLGTGPDGDVLNVWSASTTGGPVFGPAESKWFGTQTWYRYVGH